MENLKVLFPVHIRKKIKNNLWLNDLQDSQSSLRIPGKHVI